LFNVDSLGNVYFAAGVSVANYPITLNTPTHVLVAGAGGRISKVATSQLISNTDVTSVFGRKGDVVALPGDYTSEMIKEVRNLYFTIDRARSAISLTALGTSGPATYNPSTGIINVPQYQNEFNGVTSFNGRPGDVVLTALDVTTALTYTPLAVETDPIWTAQKPLYYTKVETQSYVTTQISNLIDSAPTTLDTLNELAAALGDDPNFATTITNLIATKEPAIAPGTTAQYWRGDKTWQTLPIYNLPIASATVLGGIKVGSNLSIDGSGILSAGNSYVLPTATSTILGGVKIGSGVTITSGVISVSTNYEPPIAGGTTSQYWRGDKTWQTLPVYTLSGLGGQPQLNGTGFVKASGTSISYDNSTYYLASNPSGYITSASIGNGTLTLNVSGNGLSGSTSFTANQSGSTTFTVTSNASTSATANTLVYRDSAADIYARYFFGSYVNTSDNDESGITRFVIKNGDNYHRSATTTVAANIIRGVASGTWSIAITGNAGSITNQANSATITASTGVNANHIVQRDGSGYIYANYINFNTSESENPTISSFFTSNGDGWSRKSSIAHVRNQLGNYGGWITGITSTMVTNALGYTPYNSSNPAGYITSAAISGYLPLTGGTLTGPLGGTSATFSENVGIGISPSYALHVNKSGVDVQIVSEALTANRASTNNALSNVAGVSIAAFGSTYPESGGSRWAGRAGVYINTGKPNQTFNVWIGSTTVINSLNTGWTAIGQNDPQAFFHVQGNALISGTVTATSFFESSDATLKTLIEDDYQAKGIESVVAKLYIKNGKEELGYYAQDLQAVLPSAVRKGSDGLLNLSYREVHTAKIAYLEEKIKNLENQLKNGLE
jgi:hypothetical protein